MENIIVIGHGSPRKEANNMDAIAKLVHHAIHPLCARECVKIAYLQFAEPDIMTTVKACVDGGASKIIIHPFFLSFGMHVTRDIPEKIAEARSAYPGIEFVCTEPLGTHENLIRIAVERIKGRESGQPSDIEERSFEIIDGEIDLGYLPAEQAPIVRRVIHATADFEFAQTLVFSPDAVKTGLDAIKAGKRFLTDIEMVKAGINARLLKPWGGEVICNISDAEVVRRSGETGSTRAAVSMEKGLSEDVGIVAIGNAPTALLKVIELLARGSLQGPLPLIIGVPVGFVNALESKTLLSVQKLPFITNLSRKGGTPVAVAIVNALLKMATEGK